MLVLYCIILSRVNHRIHLDLTKDFTMLTLTSKCGGSNVSILNHWGLMMQGYQWPMPSLVQIIACHLFGAKPLSEPMLAYCQLDPKEHVSIKFCLKIKSFHSEKCIWKCCLQYGSHVVTASLCERKLYMIWLDSTILCYFCLISGEFCLLLL